MSNTLKRYVVDERTGCAAIRDTKNEEYEHERPGLYSDFSSVIEFVSYYNDYNGDATDTQKAELVLKIKYLNDLCGILNGELPKPKTRTEYVKVEFERAWEAVKAFEEGEEIGQMLSDGEFSKFNLLDDVITYIDELYRKVEKEIDTREENGKAIYRLMCELEDKHEIDGYHNSWGELRDEWKEIYKELAIQVGYVAPE